MHAGGSHILGQTSTVKRGASTICLETAAKGRCPDRPLPSRMSREPFCVFYLPLSLSLPNIPLSIRLSFVSTFASHRYTAPARASRGGCRLSGGGGSGRELQLAPHGRPPVRDVWTTSRQKGDFAPISLVHAPLPSLLALTAAVVDEP
jgi:hypothetical protein